MVKLPPHVEPGGDLSPEELRRYSRHLVLPDIELLGQQRLKNAKVLCVGAGGLGSPALMYLAAAGVGTLGIVEFDTVEESNLQRQIIHGQSDVGRLKGESARDAIHDINPHVTVTLHPDRLESTNAMGVLAPYDVIIDGTDNFATRYLINDACVLLGKPYVWGSIYQFEGQASVFWAQHGPCYRCVFPEPPPPGSVPSCAEGGVLGVLCASIGSIQVTEAIKLITGIGDSLLGTLITFDALDMDYRRVTVRKNPQCAVCGDTPTVTELLDYEVFCGVAQAQEIDDSSEQIVSVLELRDLLAQRAAGEQEFVLVDVREPYEVDIVDIPGNVLIPLDRFVDGTAFTDLPRDRQVILYCKSGQRSSDALALTRLAGFADAVHVMGGVLAWVAQVEPDRPTY